MSIGHRMSTLTIKFPVLNDPITGFGEDRGYGVHNQLLEALCAVNNEGLNMATRSYQDASDRNRIEWADAATPQGPDRLGNRAIVHVCDCEKAVEEQLPPHSWYPTRDIEIVEIFQPSPQMQFIEKVYTRGLPIDWNPAPLQPNEAQVSMSHRSIEQSDHVADLERQLTYMRHRLQEEKETRRRTVGGTARGGGGGNGSGWRMVTNDCDRLG